MRISALPVLFALLGFGVFLSPGAAYAADESSPPSPPPGTTVGATSFVSAVKQSSGVVALHIDYPWAIYSKPSVEVRLLLRDRPENVRPRPMYFVDHYLTGETSITIGQCLDAAYGVGTMKQITVDHNALTLDVLGQRNSLGRPAVTVVWKSPEKQGSEQEEEQAKASQLGSWAAFCNLEYWSVNRHQLSLDLPQAYFAKPGTLIVWFLRGGTAVWERRLDWKGYPKDDSPSGR